MMRINGLNGTNTQTGIMGTARANDPVSKELQNRIADAQHRLQDLSSNEEMSFEDKMKKRQEIQQEITNLNQQLRQHQIEQRREQQSRSTSSVDDRIAGTKHTSAKKGTGLSPESMQAVISADSSMKQARVQGDVAARIKGQAGVLEAEIRQDKGRSNTEKKEAELADLREKAQSATEAQMSALAEANKSTEEAAKADGRTDAAEKDGRTDAAEKDSRTGAAETDDRTDAAKIKKNQTGKIQGKADVAKNTNAAVEHTDAAGKTEPKTAAEHPVSGDGQTVTQQAVYTPVDVRL